MPAALVACSALQTPYQLSPEALLPLTAERVIAKCNGITAGPCPLYTHPSV
jgi:hypothetical protein